MIMVALISVLIGTAATIWIVRPMMAQGSGLQVTALVTIAVMGVGALGVYAYKAQPSYPSAPYKGRLEALLDQQPGRLSLPEEEERLRYLIRQSDDDIESRRMLGRLLAQTEREIEAVAVLERAAALSPDPQTFSDLGQALVALNEGTVTNDAERAFGLAYESDPTLPEPAFFLGMARYQTGDREGAADYWTGIIAVLEDGHPYRPAIIARAADLLSRPMADQASVEAVQTGPVDVEAMVNNLARRLEDNPDDFSGWLVLANARSALRDFSASADALEELDSRFSDQPGHGEIITALASVLAERARVMVEEN